MKKLLTLLLLAPLLTFGQDKDNYMSFAAGADVTNPTDFLVQFAMVSKNVEVNLGYENFAKLDFQKYTIGLGYHFPLWGYVKGNEILTTFTPSIEPTLIDRKGNWGGGLGDVDEPSSHLSLGLNLSLNWKLNDNLAIEYTMNFLPRTDLAAKYQESTKLAEYKLYLGDVPVVTSNFIKIVYRIENE